jgi:hypothetical protein
MPEEFFKELFTGLAIFTLVGLLIALIVEYNRRTKKY